MSTQNITIDDLAAMIAKGFKETNGNLRAVDGRVGNLETRFDSLETRFDSLEGRVINIEENMATKDDIHRLERKFDSLENVVFNDHGRRLRKIEHKLQIV